MSWVAAFALFLQGLPAAGAAQRGERPDAFPDGGEGEDCTLAAGSVSGRIPLDAGCSEALREHGVSFRTLDEVGGVETPLELGSPLAGVTIRSHGARAAATLGYADCRLLGALYEWMPELSRLGVTQIEHLSIYRPGAVVRTTGRPSGHSHALAIDVSHLVFADGTTFVVERDWEHRERGADPCEVHEDESERMQGIRAAVCAASRSGLFQVVMTPHADEAHGNHVHMEVRPDVDWTILR